MIERSEVKEEFYMRTIEEINNIALTQINSLAAKSYEQQLVELGDKEPMKFKLLRHIPAVKNAAKMLARKDEILQISAALHDYGRATQFKKFGNFNDGDHGSEHDHHELGYREFLRDVEPEIRNGGLSEEEFSETLKPGRVTYKIAAAIRLHGMRGIAFDDHFRELDETTSRLVDDVSLLDDLANVALCPTFLLKEVQEQAKNVSKSGFIPDENALLTTVSPEVMEHFQRRERFNREKVCKTYPDYCAFWAILAARQLTDPRTKDIIKELMSNSIDVMYYDKKTEKLTHTVCANTLAALRFVFDQVMSAGPANEIICTLSDLYGED